MHLLACKINWRVLTAKSVHVGRIEVQDQKMLCRAEGASAVRAVACACTKAMRLWCRPAERSAAVLRITAGLLVLGCRV